MGDDAHYNFLLPPSPWSKKPYKSRHKMTIAYAAEHHPGATPILSTREVRGHLGELTSSFARPKTPEEEELQAWLISRIGAKCERIDDEKPD